MKVEFTDRLHQQVGIVLDCYDFTAEEREKIIVEWVQLLNNIPADLYGGAPPGYLEVFITYVLGDMISRNWPRG
ncbi:MAG: hypothetical protein ACRDHG_11815 [Anaerolineales bacterium]